MNKNYQKTSPGRKSAGFTLIELLVVVLIIGILAAVAVPQYEKAVYKSRLASYLPLMRAIKDANESYYLANGSYADDVARLDVDYPAGSSRSTTSGEVWYSGGIYIDNLTGRNAAIGNRTIMLQLTRSNQTCGMFMMYDHSDYPGKIFCLKDATYPKCLEVCKSLGFEESPE